MRLKKDNVKYSVHCLAHGRHSATVSNDDDDSEDRWPTFNCTSSVRSYFPPFPGILISSFHYIDFCAIIKTNFSFSFFLSFFFFRAALVAYRRSQARGSVGAIATSPHHSQSNTGSKPRLRPTPQLMQLQILNH